MILNIKKHSITSIVNCKSTLVFFVSFSVLFSLGIQSLFAQEKDKTLNIYNWSDYIAKDTIANFEKEFGIKVNYDVYDDNNLVVSKIIAGNSGYDIIVPTAGHMFRLLQANLLQKLDKSKLPNVTKYADKQLHKLVEVFDPGNQYGFIYQWGTTGIGYNVKEIAKRLGKSFKTDSWELLLDPVNAKKLADCGVVMLDAVEEVFQPILISSNIDPGKPKDSELQKVYNRLKAIRPSIRYFSSSQIINDLANGEICITIGWSGDMLQARDRAKEAGNGVEINYFIPKEGSLMWADIVAIPADAPHPQNAHLFFNYIMRPEVMADISKEVYYPNANTGAYKLLPKEFINDPLVYPRKQELRVIKMAPTFDKSIQRKANRLWSKLKTGY